MIGRKTKFVFIHVPKNGGQSISRALRPHTLSAGQQVLQRAARVIGRKSKFDLYGLYPGGGHASALEVRSVIGQAAYEDALSFAVVRNPWDRMVSLYAFERESPHRKYHHIAKDQTFEFFLENLRDLWFYDQSRFILDESQKVMVDEICRFENLSDDFKAVCDKLGVKALLPHKNASKRPKYRSLYNETTRSIVADMCARDIALFDYGF